MAISAPELLQISKTVLEFNERNKPTDQVNTPRPLLDALNRGKKTFDASRQFVEENLHTNNGGNLQWMYGSSVVTYNARSTIEKAQFAWRTAHDGFTLHEDFLAAHGVIVDDSGKTKSSSSEREVVVNILEEQLESLQLGCDELFHKALWLDGTASVDAPAGIDALVSTVPAIGVVGGIDRAVLGNTFWRNNAQTGIVSAPATGALITAMDRHWRNNSRFGKSPTHIFASAAFIDAYKAELQAKMQQTIVADPKTKRDAGYTGVYYNGIELIWVPEFDIEFGTAAPLVPWAKRCYMLNLDSIKLRPMKGHDWVTRTPPRPSNQYVFNVAKVWRGALTAKQLNNSSVLSIA